MSQAGSPPAAGLILLLLIKSLSLTKRAYIQ